MPITPQEALIRTIDHREIFHDEMVDLMRQIMRGDVSLLMIAASALSTIEVFRCSVRLTSVRSRA